MAERHKPRSGSEAYYPRRRARKETPSFRTFPNVEGDSARILNFVGYKAGMLHAVTKSQHEKSKKFGQTISVPVTIVECPAMKVHGIRAYEKGPYGSKAVGEVWAKKTDKNLKRKLKTLEKKGSKRKKAEKEAKGKGKEKEAEKSEKTISDFEKMKENLSSIRLLVHTQPALTGIGKKKPDLCELGLSGTVEEQIAFAKEKLGNEIKVNDVFEEKQFVDVKAVDTGKGFQGVIKRFGIKMQRPKAKTRRIVGSISPWKPATVMSTVARPGQMGYQNRTEFNKRILTIVEDGNELNTPSGFAHYGVTKNPCAVIAGSIPGPSKRAIAMRFPMRNAPDTKHKVGDLTFVGVVQKEEKEEKIDIKEAPGEEKNEAKEGSKEEKSEGGKEEVKGEKAEKKAESKEEKMDVKADGKKNEGKEKKEVK